MAVVRKKQDDKFLKALRELVTSGAGNRQCFDCGQKGPTYVNMTIGSFVCTRCSGVLRGLTPPHRVKSISMATFTQDEIDFLKAHGNDLCAKTWLGLWDPKRAVHQDQRELMIDKYERKRYYLEPASPLKSLTNATSLKSGGNTATNSATTQNNSNNNNNNNNSTNNGNNVSNGNVNSNNSISRGSTGGNQNAHTMSQTNGCGGKTSTFDNSFQSIQLTPPSSQRTTANGLHKSSSSAISRPQHSQNGFNNSQQQDAFMMNNGLAHNGLNASVGSASTGALSDTSSCTSNGFGPEADFVADFGSANIFDATVASSPASSSVASSSNGYAKIQPLKTAQQFMNNNGSTNGSLQLQNGNGVSNGAAAVNGNTENFADFDHAPIYNAAGHMGKSAAIANGLNNNKSSVAPTEDRYAALKDLDEQLRESKAVAAAAASIVATSVVDSFGNPNSTNGSLNGVNPFASQQQHHQQQLVANPFQATHHNTTQLFGQMTLIPNGIATANGFCVSQKPQAAAGFFNYAANGFTAATAIGGSAGTAAATTLYPNGGPNGCGFGFGALQQQIACTGGGGGGLAGNAFNNPFAATGALNSNNPFL